MNQAKIINDRIREGIASAFPEGSIEWILATHGKELTITLHPDGGVELDGHVNGTRATLMIEAQ